MNLAKQIISVILQALGLFFLLIMFGLVVWPANKTDVRWGRHIRLKDIHGQMWTIHPKNVLQLTPDFSDPSRCKIWLEGGAQIILPIEQRETIDQALR